MLNVPWCVVQLYPPLAPEEVVPEAEGVRLVTCSVTLPAATEALTALWMAVTALDPDDDEEQPAATAAARANAERETALGDMTRALPGPGQQASLRTPTGVDRSDTRRNGPSGSGRRAPRSAWPAAGGCGRRPCGPRRSTRSPTRG